MTANADNRMAELTAAAEELVDNINKLNRETGGQLVALSYRAKRNRMMIWALAASLLLDVILTLFVVNLTYKVASVQNVTKSQVLCPLYQQFVNADTPASRELARKNGQDLVKRDEAFRVIHHSYIVLGCGS